MKGRRLLVALLATIVLIALPYSSLRPFEAAQHRPYSELEDRPPEGFYDSDGDLLWDGQEALYGTRPDTTDTDADLFPDGVEVNFWLQLAMRSTSGRALREPTGDADSDGLANVLDPDSDGDGLLDGWEAANGLDPATPQTNPDGAPDEYQYYSFFRGDRNDREGDWLPDGWEEAFGAETRWADPDGDGVDNGHEYLRGTDPNGPDAVDGGTPLGLDTDVDGVQDHVETGLGLDPARNDTDGDGLPDGREMYELGTDPHDTDTDGDLRPDDVELAAGTSPVLADTDGDTLDDPAEVQTSPLLPDTDKDLIPDAEEVTPLLDSDRDGLPDAVELASSYLGGRTDPNDPDSDGDGLLDGTEDRNHNGRRDGNSPTDGDSDWGSGGETDPTLRDTDGGGSGDQDEVMSGRDPLDPSDDRQQPDQPRPRPQQPRPDPRPVDLRALAWVVLAVAIVLLALILSMMVYNTSATKEGFLEEVLEALREGERVLYDITLTDDVREAIFGAYRSFLAVMERHGHVRDDPTTAREFARAIRAAMDVDEDALHGFTVMFEVARYSDHAMGLKDRDTALAAFAAVRASIGGRRASRSGTTGGGMDATREGPAPSRLLRRRARP